MSLRSRIPAIILLVLLGSALPLVQAESVKPPVDPSWFNGLKYREIGPFRGGRSAAVAGIPGNPLTYYFGATGGGVWKTGDGGASWKNVSDGFFGGSIGAVAVSAWDPNVVYAGGGEVTVRGNVSHGSGMWKSTDAGKTWHSIGLTDTHHIPRVRVHPRNPDLVYAAALGHLYGPSAERGIFRSTDGGATWQNILFVNEEVGAVDLEMDPNNPRILYAGFWRVRRTPYSLESGGPGSGLWKSTDGGDTWAEITRHKGLPQGLTGIVGVTVSPVDSNRIWAIIEAPDGGVFRSGDAGDTWERVNEDRSLRQRAWYYTRIHADTGDRDTVYVLNVRFWKSKDGGKSFSAISTPHGDHHDLWIAPEDPRRMIVADDGGAQVTFDGGANWSTYHNQPTAQFYRVTTDNHVPYRIYGAQQDNSTVRILHRTDGRVIGERDWESTAGGESGWLAPHPENPDIVYGGSYGGYLERLDHRTGDLRRVDVWPDNPMGHGAADLKYRFQWNFPIFFSPHDPGILYTAANVLFKTTDEGESWTAISPDLTRNDTSTMGPSGGPITKDNTAVEYYGTIFTAAESPHEAGVIWAGSDDGLLHVTRDGGSTWQNVTPPHLPEWAQINSIEIDPFRPGGLYVAATRYKLDDFTPYLYRTEDYGRSWRKITTGIAPDHFTRVVRADPERPGLLYAGTESGMYISFDDGTRWQPFQMNLPIVPVTDLALKDGDLIVATQGRSFWILDDLTPLHQLDEDMVARETHLFNPAPASRFGGRSMAESGANGTNRPGGAFVYFYVEEPPVVTKTAAATTPEKDSETGAGGDNGKEAGPEIALEFLEADGTLIRRFSTRAEDKKDTLEVTAGLNRFVWDLRYAEAETFPGLVLWNRWLLGPTAVPGDYRVRLTVDEESQTVPFTLRPDPRSDIPAEDYRAQFDFMLSVRDKLSEIHRTVAQIRDIRARIDRVMEPVTDRDKHKPLAEMSEKIKTDLADIEAILYQVKNRSAQDPLNFPIRLNDKLAGLLGVAGTGDHAPTDQAVAVRDELFAAADGQLRRFRAILEEQIPAFNRLVREENIPAIGLDKEK